MISSYFFSSYIKNNTFAIKVIPNAKDTKLIEENNRLKLYLKAVPEKGKANLAVIKFFKKEYKLIVKIKLGEKNREKVLEIIENKSV